MKIENSLSDQTVLVEIGARLAQKRLAQNLTQSQLAREAGISQRTVRRLESGEVATQLTALLRVCRVLGLIERFEELVPEILPSPMAQLKLGRRKRQRASTARTVSPPPQSPWTWGDDR